MPPAAYEISSSEQGILLPFADRFHPHFVSCTTDEDPVHEVMRGYFDESQGLFSQNSDSISRFSYKVNEFISRVPAAKNDPFYIKIAENLEKVSLKPTITVNDEWGGETFVTF